MRHVNSYVAVHTRWFMWFESPGVNGYIRINVAHHNESWIAMNWLDLSRFESLGVTEPSDVNTECSCVFSIFSSIPWTKEGVLCNHHEHLVTHTTLKCASFVRWFSGSDFLDVASVGCVVFTIDVVRPSVRLSVTLFFYFRIIFWHFTFGLWCCNRNIWLLTRNTRRIIFF